MLIFQNTETTIQSTDIRITIDQYQTIVSIPDCKDSCKEHNMH